MVNIDILNCSPYDLFRYYSVFFETSDTKIPLVEGKPMLLLYMGSQCKIDQALPRPITGKPGVFTMELPSMKIFDLRKLAEEYYMFGIFFSRNIMNAPEELFVRNHTAQLDKYLEAFADCPRWTYNSVLGQKNMTPPILPANMALTSTNRLKAFAMCMEDDKPMHLQAQVGVNQHWQMGGHIFNSDKDAIYGIALRHPQASTQLSVPLSWLSDKTNQTNPDKIIETISIEMQGGICED